MEGHQLGRLIKQGPKSGSSRTKRVAMVQSNLGFPADNVDELLGFLSESRWEQQSNLEYSPCKLKLDSIKCKSTSSAIASDLILKQRNLNSRAEMPLHYPQGTGGSKTPKKPYQDNVRNASCIRVRQNAGRQRLEGFTSAARFCESDAGTYRFHNQASVPRTSRKHVLQEVDQEPAFQKSGVQVQRNLQSRKALERSQPSHISDATLCSSFYKSSSQKEPHGGGGGINDLQFPLTLDDLAPICHLSTEERSTTLQAIIESSWTSASLHRSMMDFRDQDYQPESECAGPQSSGSFRVFPSCQTTSSLLDPGAIRNTWQSENNESYTAQISCSVVHHLGEGEGHYPASKLATSLGRGMCVKRDACITEPLHPHSRFVNFDQSFPSDSESCAERFNFPDSTVAVSLVASIEPLQSQKKCIINPHGRNAERYFDNDPGVIDLLAAQGASRSENTVFPKGPQSFNTTAPDACLRRHADSLPSSSLIQHHRVTMEELRGTKLSLDPDIFNCRSAMENSDLCNIKRSNEIEKLNTDICEESQLKGQLRPERETRDKIQSSAAGKDPERQSRNDRRVVVEQDQRASGSSLISSQAFEESYGFSRDDNGAERRSEGGMERSVGSVAQEPLKSSDPSVIHCLDPVERTEESLMKVHRHRLLAKCFNAWNSFVRLKNAAGRLVHEGQVLHKGLVALNWAVAVRHMQADTIAARRKTRMLSQVFKQWKAAFAHRQKLVESTCDCDLGLEALRRRLIQPSDQLVLRTAYCVWRRQVTGSRIHRAAQIHYNLTLLWRHWLVWRQLRIRRNAQRQQTLALVYMESSLKRKAFTVWTAMMYKNCLAHSHYRSHTLSTVFRVWRVQLLYVQAERSKQDRLSREFQNTTLLKQSFQHWRIKLAVHHMQLRRQQRITRITAHRWLQTVQQRKLEDLRLRANQLQNRMRLAAAFRTWCELKAAAETEQAGEEEGRHLLGKKKMQVVFTTWHLCCQERQRLQPLRLQIQRRQLSGCFEAWRRLVLQKSLSRSRVDELQRQTVRQCFQHWRRLLQLHWQHKTFLTRVLEDRRQRARETWKECEKNQDDCWAVGLHQRRACRGVDELSEDLVLQRALLKWKGECCKLQLASSFFRAREKHRLRQILSGWHRWAEQSLEGKVQRFGARLEQDLSRTVALPFIEESSISSGFHSNSPVCLSLDVSCSSAEQADQEVSYERTDLKACRIVSRGDVMKREPQVDLSERSLEQEECEPPLRTSSPLHSPQHGMEIADGLNQAVDVCSFSQSEQSAMTLYHSRHQRLKGLCHCAVVRMMHPSLSVSFYQWMEYVVMRQAERLLIGDFKERKNQSVMIWAFETWNEKKRSIVKARKHQDTVLQVHVIAVWKSFVSAQRSKEGLLKQATRFRNFHLLNMSFRTWEEQKKNLKVIRLRASELYRTERMGDWLQRKLERRRVQQGFALWAAQAWQAHNVKLYHRNAQLTRVLVAWREVTRAALLHKDKVVLFQTHTERRLLASCFTQWITNLQIAQQRQIALERSIIKQQNVQRATVMQRWKLATRGSQAHRIHNTALLKQAFDQWKEAAEAARIAEQRSREKEKRRLKLFYSSWSIWVKENKEQRLKSEVWRFHWQKRRMHHAFHQWITAQNNQAEADTLYQTHLLQRPFLKWMTVVQEQKQFSIVAVRRIGTLQVKAAFNTWRSRLEMHQALDSHLQKARQRTLRTAVRSWHHQVLSSQCRTRYLCKKYYCRWTQVVSLGTQRDSEGVLHTRTEEKCRRELGEKYLKKWRCAVLLKRFQRTQRSQRTERTWDQWRSLTGAVQFINNMCERRPLEKAWMRWRKRRIQAKVSQAFSAQQHRALLSEVFTAWRQVALSQKEDRGRVT
ncbi:uncharacterized protein LOC117426095 isoform X1 [Acipenser ruthenus]|uniref:uncharacterized protein LOC117426095 isoform X1 n=2 Tax=Acipenser ruthenus TaxID=7906 RepID=UPI0027404236|nr:uncharacterized protein LOC117426095 isoform X1 [Acipenser ruthenus]